MSCLSHGVCHGEAFRASEAAAVHRKWASRKMLRGSRLLSTWVLFSIFFAIEISRKSSNDPVSLSDANKIESDLTIPNCSLIISGFHCAFEFSKPDEGPSQCVHVTFPLSEEGVKSRHQGLLLRFCSS